MPSDDDLDTLAEHVDQILDRGTPAQRKALIEQLVEEIQIVGPSRIRPIYRVPTPSKDAEPAADDGTTVRKMGNLVGRPPTHRRGKTAPNATRYRRCRIAHNRCSRMSSKENPGVGVGSGRRRPRRSRAPSGGGRPTVPPQTPAPG